jgi:hypothetical protein
MSDLKDALFIFGVIVIILNLIAIMISDVKMCIMKII